MTAAFIITGWGWAIWAGGCVGAGLTSHVLNKREWRWRK